MTRSTGGGAGQVLPGIGAPPPQTRTTRRQSGRGPGSRAAWRAWRWGCGGPRPTSCSTSRRRSRSRRGGAPSRPLRVSRRPTALLCKGPPLCRDAVQIGLQEGELGGRHVLLFVMQPLLRCTGFCAPSHLLVAEDFSLNKTRASLLCTNLYADVSHPDPGRGGATAGDRRGVGARQRRGAGACQGAAGQDDAPPERADRRLPVCSRTGFQVSCIIAAASYFHKKEPQGCCILSCNQWQGQNSVPL